MSGSQLTAALALLGTCGALVSGCLGVETTQDKSAKLSEQAVDSLKGAKGLKITTPNAQVKIEQKAIVQDETGVAAVVRVHNTGSTQVQLPIAITVSGAKGKKLYANDVPGIEPALVSLPVLAAGESADWVNNQITVVGKAKQLQAQVGAAKPPGASVPKITISKVHFSGDSSGTYARGVIRNESSVVQKRLTVFCVARKGDTVVAAGRAVVEKLDPAAGARKPTEFTVYFIGKPTGAELDCTAPATNLSGSPTK